MTTAQKITVAALKRSLAVGTEFTAEFIGVNATHAAPGMVKTRRKVTKQKADMVSEILDGPKNGLSIWLNWKGLSVTFVDGSYILTDYNNMRPMDFLKITIH